MSGKVVHYPVPGVTLQRCAAVQRSAGDGEEQAPVSVLQDAILLRVPQNAATKKTKTKVTKMDYVNERKNSTKSSDRESDKDSVTKKCASPPSLPELKGVKKSSSVPSLPEVKMVANKLTKVPLFTSPDMALLNVPPKDLSSKKIIPLTAKKQIITSPIDNKTVSLQTSVSSNEEPKFIPYEPYRGCVKPIFKRKKSKGKGKTKVQQDIAYKSQPCLGQWKEEQEEEPVKEPSTAEDVNIEQLANEKVKILVADFEKEKLMWEQQKHQWEEERATLQKELAQIKQEKMTLNDQLSVQSQVNSELKKLLVASVGEDVQGRVQCLTEDKARMATMIRRYSERVDKDYEEKEKIAIQCDVWRSKFLASGVLVDELAGWKATLMRRLDEAEEALHVLLDEHLVAQKHLASIFKLNKQLCDAFDPLAATSGTSTLTSADLLTLALEGDSLAETVRDRLLGDLGRAVGCNSINMEGLETLTPGEKIAQQVLEHGSNGTCSRMSLVECSTVSPGRSAMMHRFHPSTRYEHVTVNCCAHCNGEIKVV
ncbi:uncharacterized protein LOC143037434 isoform X2 [Oratosquilla oratoria]|uniref:uncharacterized protein LOC143037434 isoform X2 n=1 Tax=Oratosquilla oratoria TaxID=337810 RepID=UPI003F771FDA